MIELGIYKHYKGDLYWVREVVLHTEDEEDLVIYSSIETGRGFARPLKMWFDKVEWPDGVVRPRFVFKRRMTQLG